MNRNRISCPHCRQEMEVREDDAEKTLRCVRCQKTFGGKSETAQELPQKTVSIPVGESVISVRCQECDARFGVKISMSGKTIACPVCRAKQVFELTSAESDSAGTPVITPVITNESPPGNRATVINSNAGSKDSAQDLSSRALELLPPRFTVTDDVEANASIEIKQEEKKGILLGIDTDVTRIHRQGEAIPVRSMTLNEKRRRKSLRVTVVFLVSVAILIVLFVWLLNGS